MKEKKKKERKKKKRRKKKNNTKYSGHFVPQQHLQAAHALRLDKNFANIITDI